MPAWGSYFSCVAPEEPRRGRPSDSPLGRGLDLASLACTVPTAKTMQPFRPCVFTHSCNSTRRIIARRLFQSLSLPFKMAQAREDRNPVIIWTAA